MSKTNKLPVLTRVLRSGGNKTLRHRLRSTPSMYLQSISGSFVVWLLMSTHVDTWPKYDGKPNIVFHHDPNALLLRQN